MKYTLITAALAATSLATVVNIDVEGTDLAGENNRHHNGKHHSMNKHHHHHQHKGHHHHGGNRWLADLFSWGSEERKHEHHHQKHNHRRMHELVEELFKINFECTKDSEWSKEQFMECYRRRADDVHDGLVDFIGLYDLDAPYGPEYYSRHKHYHHHDHHRGHRYEDANGQAFIDSDRSKHGRKHHRKENEYECRIELEDPMRRDEVARQCCEEQQLGRYNPQDQTCEIEGREDKDEFEQCAMQQGAIDAYCQRERTGRDD